MPVRVGPGPAASMIMSDDDDDLRFKSGSQCVSAFKLCRGRLSDSPGPAICVQVDKTLLHVSRSERETEFETMTVATVSVKTGHMS
eukprot:3823095-Rhodomonas_salina.1